MCGKSSRAAPLRAVCYPHNLHFYPRHLETLDDSNAAFERLFLHVCPPLLSSITF